MFLLIKNLYKAYKMYKARKAAIKAQEELFKKILDSKSK